MNSEPVELTDGTIIILKKKHGKILVSITITFMGFNIAESQTIAQLSNFDLEWLEFSIESYPCISGQIFRIILLIT